MAVIRLAIPPEALNKAIAMPRIAVTPSAVLLLAS